MELKTLKASEFKKMFSAGAEQLENNVELINTLNVFPVPDGDTGTNMNMSFKSGVEKLNQTQSEHIGELANALAKGLLMGARGNSGVILSQIFRGFSQAISDEEELNGQSFAAAFMGGVESAYKAVMKPVEGTILTVARESALAGEKKSEESDNVIEILRAIVKGAEISLEKTPDLLPVLKQVGVVDSGGKGLLTIYEGFLSYLSGETIISDEEKAPEIATHSHAMFDDNVEEPLTMDDITYGFCTEIMVQIGQGPTVEKPFDYDHFRNTLNEKGDSLLVVADDEIIKVHIHTENPGEIMQLGQEYGELIKIKVDNMREQVRDLEEQEHDIQSQSASTAVATREVVQHKNYAVIAVAAGQGMKELFESIGVDVVLSGGQTMNPSTQDFIDAIERVDADNIIILPNNKNIIMAAEQATSVAEVPTIVVPTVTIPQGIAGLIGFNSESDLESNKANMEQMMVTAKSGQVTYAIRDTEINGLSIKKDDFMGLVEGDIVVANPEVEDTLNDTLAMMIDEFTEIITIIVGEDGSVDFAEEVAEALMEENDEIEVDVVKGDQPVYHYILSVE